VNTYIIIPARKSDEDSGRIAILVADVLHRILPSANPDFDDFIYDRVVAFHVELDSDGSPERELGIDSGGQVVFIAPWRENLGVILDIFDEPFEASKYEQISAEQFQREWESFTAPKVA